MPNIDRDLEKLLIGGGHNNSDEIVVNEFTEASAQNFRDKLLDSAKKDPREPVVVYIDSYGGEVDSLAKMIETMDEVPNPIITVAIGKAISCGAILLSHGDMRLCGKHSRIMVHEISAGTAGDVHDLNADAVEFKRMNRHFLGLLAKNCGIKGGYDALRKMIKDQDGRDKYMDADEAVKFGIVDAIGLPKVSKVLTYQVQIVPPKSRLRKQSTADKGKTKKSDSKKSK